MSPWVLLGVAVAWGASLTTVGVKAYSAGEDHQIAKMAETSALIRAAREAAQQGAAEAIAKIRPRNVTIQQEVEREIQTRVEYRDCRHSADGLRLINEALTGKPSEPASASKLPGARAAGR